MTEDQLIDEALKYRHRMDLTGQGARCPCGATITRPPFNLYTMVDDVDRAEASPTLRQWCPLHALNEPEWNELHREALTLYERAMTHVDHLSWDDRNLWWDWQRSHNTALALMDRAALYRFISVITLYLAQLAEEGKIG